MSGKEEMRIFVGGLSWETTDRQLEDAFSRYGKIIEAQNPGYYLLRFFRWIVVGDIGQLDIKFANADTRFCDDV